MDQDETWHAGRPSPWPHCVRWEPSSLLPQNPIFGTCLLWPNGWMDQDGTCLGPGHIVLDGNQLPPPEKRGHRPHSPKFSARVYCDQNASTYIRMPLDTEVGLSLGDIVLDGDTSAPFLKGYSPSNFRPVSVVAKRLDGLTCHSVA